MESYGSWQCDRCKTMNAGGARYCKICGEPRIAGNRGPAGGGYSAPKPPKRGRKGRIAALLIGAAVLVLAAGGIVYLLRNPASKKTEEPKAVVSATEAPTKAPAKTPKPTNTPQNAIETMTPEPKLADDSTLGSFSITALDGRTIDETFFAGNRLTMVNYWATWCGPCVGEMPDLEKLAGAYASEGFAIVGVLYWDEDYDGARKFLEEEGITYPSIPCQEPFDWLGANIEGIPTTLFFDSSGNEVGDVYIGSRSYHEWASIVEGLLP